MYIDTQTLTEFKGESLKFIVSDIQEENYAASLIRTVPSLIMMRYLCSDAQMVAEDNCYQVPCVRLISDKVFGDINKWRQFNAYLFFSHDAWQPKNRITKYNKLWKSFRTKYDVEPFLNVEEQEFEMDVGIRYAALVKLDALGIPTAVNILLKERSSAILLATQRNLVTPEQVKTIFYLAFTAESGIPRTSINWPNLIKSLCPQNVLLVKTYGAVEAGEVSLNVIGTLSAVNQFNTKNVY